MFSHIKKLVDHFGKGTLFIIILTFILFTVALFVKGFTHDLLIEVAVFLVSVKLILMTYDNSMTSKKLETKLNEIEHKIDSLKKQHPNRGYEE